MLGWWYHLVAVWNFFVITFIRVPPRGSYRIKGDWQSPLWLEVSNFAQDARTMSKLPFLLYFYLNSRHLHDSMFWKILLAKMRFFHINPIGRVLNRFSQDMALVDGQLISSAGFVSRVRFISSWDKIMWLHTTSNFSTGHSSSHGPSHYNYNLSTTFNCSPNGCIDILCSCNKILHFKSKVLSRLNNLLS